MHAFFIRLARIQFVRDYMQNGFIDNNELRLEVCNVSIYIFNFVRGINYSLTIKMRIKLLWSHFIIGLFKLVFYKNHYCFLFGYYGVNYFKYN
ncbi:hypothetical protein BCU71_15695 [Vibrio lentus]|nr:hypothetical protein BCU99_18010 [Vibrio cyclitrophicus]PMH30226.1 hypothetical protein BCU71_15695 [Vibrio lentus]PMK68224.1 hypothetical protein BCT93_19600 [Vibrio lentus]